MQDDDAPDAGGGGGGTDAGGAKVNHMLPVAVSCGVCVVIVAILVAVIVSRMRKRAQSRAIWFPEGFKLVSTKKSWMTSALKGTR